MERLITGSTDGGILLVARRTEESAVAMSKRPVNQIRFTVGTHETLLMPVLLLETDILHNASSQ